MRTPNTHWTRRNVACICLVAFACAALALGCGDDTPSDGDAAVDLDAGADAWTYHCPETQPEGTMCFRGQVRDLITDAPVQIPAGAIIQWFSPEEPGDHPTILATEAEVQPDGRFIFTHAPHHPNEYPDESQIPMTYSYGTLLLNLRGETLDGSVIPDNKYGFFCPECFTEWYPNADESSPIYSYYVIPDYAFGVWDQNADDGVFWDEPERSICEGNRFLPEMTYKLTISVQGRVSVDATGVPIGDPSVKLEYLGIGAGRGYPREEHYCAYLLEMDRLSGIQMMDLTDYSGITLVPVYSMPEPTLQRVFARVAWTDFLPTYPNWAAIGDSYLDPTGRVVVIHYQMDGWRYR